MTDGSNIIQAYRKLVPLKLFLLFIIFQSGVNICGITFQLLHADEPNSFVVNKHAIFQLNKIGISFDHINFQAKTL